MTRVSSSSRTTFTEMLDFVEARGVEDIAGSCRLCRTNDHLADVGVMARDWVDRLRGREPTERQLSWTAWIAALHEEHEDYRREWSRLQRMHPFR